MEVIYRSMFIVAMLATACCAYAQAVTNSPPYGPFEGYDGDLAYHYPNAADAIRNGSNVVVLITMGQYNDAKSFVGKKVVLVGGAASDGGKADLILVNGFRLNVDVYPPEDVRPHAAYWVACVLGELLGVDVEKKVIHIKAKPGDWHSLVES